MSRDALVFSWPGTGCIQREIQFENVDTWIAKDAEIARVDSCIYDVSPDEDFILDRLPSDPRVIFATGLSGHGFKFGLLLGDILSSLVCNTEPPVPLDRFHLSRFENRQEQYTNSVA